MISLFLAMTLTCGQASPPPTLEMFANESFYKEQAGKEETFTGVLSKINRAKGVIGFGRFNPVTLKMADGKVREVYLGGKLDLLDPYIGKTVKLVGKAVDMEVEGRNHLEIWAARLEVVADAKKAEKRDSTSSTSNVVGAAGASTTGTTSANEGGKTDGPKVHAKAALKIGATSTAIRSAEELAKLNSKAEDVARFLKVDKIDFSKQMLVVISGGSRPTGGYGVEFKDTEVKDKKLVVHWVLKTPAKDAFVTQAFTHPMLVVLMDRFDGDVVFDPAPPKVGGGKRPLDRN
jgi:hypothetical protein